MEVEMLRLHYAYLMNIEKWLVLQSSSTLIHACIPASLVLLKHLKKNNERNCHRLMVDRFKLSMPIVIIIFWIRLKALKFWSEIGWKCFCSTTVRHLVHPDEKRKASIWTAFWKNFEKQAPQHPIFSRARSGEVCLERCVAVVAGQGHTAWLDESHEKALQQDVAEFLALQKNFWFLWFGALVCIWGLAFWVERWHVGCTPCFINGIVWPCWISGIAWSCWIIGIVWSCWIIGIVWVFNIWVRISKYEFSIQWPSKVTQCQWSSKITQCQWSSKITQCQWSSKIMQCHWSSRVTQCHWWSTVYNQHVIVPLKKQDPRYRPRPQTRGTKNKSDYIGKNSYVFDKIMTNLADYLMYNLKVSKILLARRSFGQSAWE